MIKKENGVTLTILLVTIVIMIILAGVIMSISMSLTKTSEIKEIVANMELIRGVASDYINKYLDDSEIERDDTNNITSIKVSTKFIGTKEDPHQANSIIQQLLRSTYLDSEFLNLLSQEKGWYWYRLDKTDLDKMGLNNIDLDNEGHILKSTVENPVVVIIEHTWKNACCKAIQIEENESLILNPITTVDIKIIPK